MLPLVYHPSYSFPLPANHRFPVGKYLRLKEGLAEDLAAVAHRYFSAEPDPLYPAHWHCPDYVQGFLSQSLPATMARRIGFPMSDQLIERTLAANKGTLLCAELALDHGLALHLSGGYHHAHYAQGGGFCIFNDLAMAAQTLVDQGKARRVLVFDCDVHQGDGTATMLAQHPDCISVSVHAQRNYPARKPDSDLDVALPEGLTDQPYLDAVTDALDLALRYYQPDLVLYDAGVDIHADDELGHFKVSSQGLLHRDRLVLSRCLAKDIPVAAVIGGGYQRDLQGVVNLHRLLFKAAAELAP
ncbi:histone deacetylase [Gallaecimonas xiamenensis]|uniref:Histone deacetylase superfamily protein n=1 Tax=Gallaecimonas xiamenensis 3-C-1 TaxID=745411 RepID=K2JDV5_9GAMM|nr:histone deacetylase [Gallaecimonas xiamenensis]EKE68734.1 histone deacetylase superfamily protein [Gallaecimonas xiamenensis 3-C-1]